MRKLHRYLAVIAIVFGLFASTTGLLLQSIDLKTILSHAPDTDPNLGAIREGADGPRNFQVRTDDDYGAAPLPAAFNYDAALAKVVPSARAAFNNVPLSFVEFRMAGDRPIARVASGKKLVNIDSETGQALSGPDLPTKLELPQSNHPSLRNTVKNIHRALTFGDVAVTIYTLLALMMCVMLVTGLVLYFKLFNARTRMGRKGAFWSAGGIWRSLHRSIAISSSVLLFIVIFSGTMEAIGSYGVLLYRVTNHGQRPGLVADVSSPLSDAQLAGMLHTSLAAYRTMRPGDPVKVLRLRTFAGMPQGVFVTGGRETVQVPINAATGERASLYEPSYPSTGQTWGWQNDQLFKSIHRGDIIGVSGRMLSLLTGLALLFMSVSGAVMYFEMWNRRRRAGKPGLFWG